MPGPVKRSADLPRESTTPQHATPEPAPWKGPTAEHPGGDRGRFGNAGRASAERDPGPPLPPVARVPPWRVGLLAARANAVPGLLLTVFAVGLLLSYWNLPAVEAALQRVGTWKLRGGFAFSAVSTALFGGIIPGLVQRARPLLRHTMPWRHLAFLTLFWAYKGVEVDLLYRLQADWFGNGQGLGTILPKVAVDQGLYVPLLAVPPTALAYAFKDADLSLRRTLAPIHRQGLGRWVYEVAFPLLLSNWGVWIPAVVVIYCLPLPLQLPMQNLVLCFWSLLLILQVRPADVEPDRAGQRGI